MPCARSVSSPMTRSNVPAAEALPDYFEDATDAANILPVMFLKVSKSWSLKPSSTTFCSLRLEDGSTSMSCQETSTIVFTGYGEGTGANTAGLKTWTIQPDEAGWPTA